MNFADGETNLKTPFLDKHPQSAPYTIDAEALAHEYPKSSYESTNSPSLNEINYVNLFTFLVNFMVTYLVGIKGVGMFLSNRELAEKYQSIVTPAGYTFSIWSFIFVAQTMFIIVQLLPQYRGIPLVQVGINYWYFFASLFQVGWTITFSFELIPISLVMMLFVLVSIIGLLISQGKIIQHMEVYTWKEYWFLKFPFEILCGWIIAAFAVNINILVVFLNTSAECQVIFAIFLLVGLYAVGVAKSCIKRATHIIPLVMAWATFGIFVELRSPKPSILNTFSMETIESVQMAAVAISIFILLQIAVRISYCCASQRQQH